MTYKLDYFELPFCSALLSELAAGVWLRTGVPMTTSSRGFMGDAEAKTTSSRDCRGGLDLAPPRAPVSTGSRLVVERTFMARSALLMEPPGKAKDRRSCLGIGRSRE